MREFKLDLNMGGKKIAVLKGTTTESRLKATLERRLVNATIVPVDTGNQGIAMIVPGRDGDDAQIYLERQVQEKIKESKQ